MALQPYTKEWLEELCANSFSYAEVTKKAGRKGGGAQATVKKKIQEFGIDVSHFTGKLWSKGKTKETDERLNNLSKNKERYSLDEVFIKNSQISQHGLRGYIERYQIIPYICDICGCDGNWQGGQIKLEVHHLDGNNTNNEISNLIYLCPNCHALTENFRAKNRITQSQEALEKTDEEFIEALKTTPNIRQALLKLNLATYGANYNRARKILETYNITQK